ncbi:Uncharacterised protein [Mycobacteroides abscessus subsp. abscessus]|nr:Uncharacterised protein [Mycobacteroides abscessus subsp. abscessus]
MMAPGWVSALRRLEVAAHTVLPVTRFAMAGKCCSNSVPDREIHRTATSAQPNCDALNP